MKKKTLGKREISRDRYVQARRQSREQREQRSKRLGQLGQQIAVRHEALMLLQLWEGATDGR